MISQISGSSPRSFLRLARTSRFVFTAASFWPADSLSSFDRRRRSSPSNCIRYSERRRRRSGTDAFVFLRWACKVYLGTSNSSSYSISESVRHFLGWSRDRGFCRPPRKQTIHLIGQCSVLRFLVRRSNNHYGSGAEGYLASSPVSSGHPRRGAS